jgi:2-oxoglutarate dehydrogenase E2 component (dihydrolipoamide succinyltransferase)
METDKVTLEIEAPEDGVLSEILAEPDTEVSPEMVIGRINTEPAATSGDQPKTQTNKAEESVSQKTPQKARTGKKNLALSPAVKRFVLKHDIDVTEISGSGKNQRITLNDVKAYVANLSSTKQVEPEFVVERKPSENYESSSSTLIPHTSMRRSIAKHMSSSVAEAPHVTAVFEADFSAIAAHRAAFKEEFSIRGVKLTYTAYILMACAEAMKAVPEVNSQWHDDAVEVFSDINIGVGTALGDKGLVVPVINRVQERNLFGVAKELQQITTKARDSKLKPNDMKGGTFTISNHGVSGSLVATPIIINQPQSAILGVGKLEKRVVVRSMDGQDIMVIKPMAYVSLTIDHRVIDGHQTNAWLSTFVSTLENWGAD